MRLLYVIIIISFALSACGTGSPTPTSPPEPIPAQVTPTIEIGCSMVSANPTPAAQNYPQIPPVTEADFTLGPTDATVTLVEYCDFQAPGCRGMALMINRLMEAHTEELRVVFRPLPLIGQLDKSELAVRAALAAYGQGKFWEMHSLLFDKYDEWTPFSPEQFKKWIFAEAVKIGISKDQFSNDFDSRETLTAIQTLFNARDQLRIAFVPFIFLNDISIPVNINYTTLNDTINLILLGERQFTECPPFDIDPSKQYLATLHTEKGDVVIELYADQAPLAVNSFIFLARQGWFDGITFHRVIPGFMAQTGDPSGTGQGNPGYFFKNETNAFQYDQSGVVGMANSGQDTNGSQFFITYAPAPHLNGGFTVFGRVLKGMEVIDQLTPRNPEQFPDSPPGDMLISVEIQEN